MSVEAWEDQLPLKTYLLGPNDPYPPWNRTGWGRIYPYPMQDDLTDETRVVPYRALHLENEYLHAIVLPEIGGHLHSLYDKVAGREAFYRNHVVKYGFVARRGAWISGGIEFNFPMGHHTMTVSPVQSKLARDPETGEASITVGYTDRVSRMRCAVTLSLAPGDARMRQDVSLYNPMPYRQRHYFWANSAVPASDDLHLVYPCARATTGGGQWPYPMVNGVDMSWYRNHKGPNDIFALDTLDDFFGCYYTDSDAGLVHWSDHRADYGKKFFTWGTADEGMIWVDLLTDDDGQYVEIQSGRFVDQSTFEFLSPYQRVGWSEYWYPLHGMGGFVWASDEAALNLEVDGDRAKIAAMVSRGGGEGSLVLRIAEKEVWRHDAPMGVGQPLTMEAPLPAGIAPDAAMSLALVVDHEEVVRYENPPAYLTRRPLEIKTEVRPADDPEATARDLSAHAIAAEKVVDFDAARGLYEKALANDEGCARAHLGLGILDLMVGEYQGGHLSAALACDPENDEAWYYLAVASEAAGKIDDAKDALWRLLGRTACSDEAALRLAALAIRDGDYHLAFDLVDGRPMTARSMFLISAALRLGSLSCEEASAAGLALDPLAGEFEAERYLAAREAGDEAAAEAAFARLRDLFIDDPGLWLEMAYGYVSAGLRADAAVLLQAACERIEAVAGWPMIHYLLYYMTARREDLARAAASPGRYCFPSRPEEIPVLQEALDASTDDIMAREFLGSLMASLGRRDEAMARWEEASDDGNETSRRNLALAYGVWYGDWRKSADWYEDALNTSDPHYRLYLERDHALQRAGEGAEARLAALEDAGDRPEIAARRVDCLVQLGEWDEAINMMTTYRFKPWEGARQMHVWWSGALRGRAAARREAGDMAGALADYELALTYPRNLGVGRAAWPQEAELHWLAAEVAGAVGDEAKRAVHLAAAAEEEHQGLCDADLPKLLALRALGRTGEAEELAPKLRDWATERLAKNADDAGARQIMGALA
jgi:hypothetical protein